MDTGYVFDIINFEITYTSPFEDGFSPVKDEE